MSVSLLATPEDVARVLQVDEDTLPEGTTWALEVASAWVRRYVRNPALGIKGETAVSFSDRRADAFLLTGGVPTKVEVRRGNGMVLETLREGVEWSYDGAGVRLRPEGESWGSYDPRFGYRGLDRVYPEVVVTYTEPDDIEIIVIEATAHIAAAMISQAPRAAKGLTSEMIGDYSYNRGVTKAAESSSFFVSGKDFLRILPGAGGVPFVP